MKFLTHYIIIFIYLVLPYVVTSQSIKVYFNQSVNNTISAATDAQTSAFLDDTIVAFIDQSLVSLDVAVWDNGSTKIVNAINAAYSRGVQVRYITSSNSLNTALSSLNPAISVLERNSGLTSDVMHNKFIIVDNQQLLTGSMNFGDGSVFDDYNNIVLIADPNLSQAYTTEFNEMWGTTLPLPNLANSKFGPDKTDNTTHSFTVAGSPIQSYFSPTDNTTARIVDAINSADYTLDIALFTFIHNDIGDAVIAAKERGVYVRCIIENTSYLGSEFNSLVSAGIVAYSHQSVPYDFHHKYCIIDAFYGNSDALVVTGSHNWTNSAEDEYDENTLMIHNQMIAQQYTEEFVQRFVEMGGNSLNEEYSSRHYIYPNPSNGEFTLSNSNFNELIIFDLLGSKVYSNSINSSEIVCPTLPTGTYILQLKNDDSLVTQKIIID
jgi:phosphatidylserine/phosphatidylglycerophosphate/cardiolipin synthase-like enzyme